MKRIYVAAFFACISCSKFKENDAVLKIAVPTQTIQLDPHHYEDLYSMTVIRQVYRGLFSYTPDGRIVPDLVDRWENSPDKMTYSFYLKDAFFSDGTAIDASHVESSLKRIFSEKGSLSSDLALIQGAEAYLDGEPLSGIQIRAVSKKLLTITTSAPSSLLLYLLANPDAAILKIDDPLMALHFGVSSVYSGTYKVTAITPGHLELSKWRHSDVESAAPPQTVLINLQSQVSERAVLAGLVTDTSNFMTLDQKGSTFEGLSDWRSVVSEATNERFIVLNPKKLSKSARSWMLAQVNQDDFVKRLGDSSIVAAYGFIPPFLPGSIARRLAPANVSAPTKVEFAQVIYGANLPYPEIFVNYLKEVWRHPNLKLEFKSVPVSEYLSKLFTKEGEVVIAAKGIDYPEGFAAVAYFRSKVDSNFLFVKDEQIDKLITQAASETNQGLRAELYRQIQTRVINEATVIPLAFGAWKKHYWHKRVKHVPPHPLGVQFIPFEMIGLQK